MEGNVFFFLAFESCILKKRVFLMLVRSLSSCLLDRMGR